MKKWIKHHTKRHYLKCVCKSLPFYLFFTLLLHGQNTRRVSAPHVILSFAPSFFSPFLLQFLLCLFLPPSSQFKSDRCLSATSELREWKRWKPQAGSHCKSPAPRLPAQTPSFRSTSWNWGCFLIKALVDWTRLRRGWGGGFLKLHLTGICKFTRVWPDGACILYKSLNMAVAGWKEIYQTSQKEVKKKKEKRKCYLRDASIGAGWGI